MKELIIIDMHAALKAGQKQRLQTLRLILAAIKQKEIDERKELNQIELIQVLNKLAKQRNESITQFNAAGRYDLCAKEQAELDLIREYLPAPLGKEVIDQLIRKSIAQTHATSIKDMGKVMKILQPQLQGRASLRSVSDKVKSLLDN